LIIAETVVGFDKPNLLESTVEYSTVGVCTVVLLYGTGKSKAPLLAGLSIHSTSSLCTGMLTHASTQTPL